MRTREMGSSEERNVTRSATISYLPGVVPPPSPAASQPQGADVEPLSPLGPEPIPAPAEGRGAGSAAKRAENVSMRALTRRGLSALELRDILVARGLDLDDAQAEVDRLEGVGLIDDAALAETIVRTQHERKGLGRAALNAELRRRRIDQQHIDNALEQVDDDDEQRRATDLALKRAPQLHSFDRETAVRRLSGYLMRKGYSGSVVRAAVDEALPRRSSSGVSFS